MPESPKYFTLTPEQLEEYVVEEETKKPPKPDKKDRSGFTKEQLEVLSEIFGKDNLEQTSYPSPDQLTDDYFAEMYPEAQSEQNTQKGLVSFHPSWWNNTADVGFSITDEEAEKRKTKRATWGELYIKSMRAEAPQFQNAILFSETIQKPNYTNGSQHYGTKEGIDQSKDQLLPIIREVFGSTANRFNLTWNQINQELIPKIKEKLLHIFKPNQDFDIIITPATISNLQTTHKHPSDSQTSTHDWTSTPLINQNNQDSGYRLVVGNSGNGGAGCVGYVGLGGSWGSRGFRLSVVLRST